MTQQISGIPAEMRACQIVEFNKPHEIRTIPTPKELRPFEILLKVAAASVCHTDSVYQSGAFPIQLPVTGCHEGAGTVIAVGSNVGNFKPSDRVLAGMIYDRCGKCEVCKGPEKFRHYCETVPQGMMSVGRNGPWQEYLVVDARESSLIPDQMSFATAAPLACAGAAAWHGIQLCDLKSGDWIGIVGSGGGLGHLAIQMSKAKGFKVLAVDARDEGLALSKECGADIVVDARSSEEEIVKAAREATGSSGVAATVNLSDHSSAIPTACAITKVSGTVIQVAIAEPASMSVNHYILRDIRLRGSFMASQAETQDMLEQVVKHNIKVKNHLFHGLNETTKVISMLQSAQYQGKGTIIIDEEAFKDDEVKNRT